MSQSLWKHGRSVAGIGDRIHLFRDDLIGAQDVAQGIDGRWSLSHFGARVNALGWRGASQRRPVRFLMILGLLDDDRIAEVADEMDGLGHAFETLMCHQVRYVVRNAVVPVLNEPLRFNWASNRSYLFWVLSSLEGKMASLR
jgi:hypothetical protein